MWTIEQYIHEKYPHSMDPHIPKYQSFRQFTHLKNAIIVAIGNNIGLSTTIASQDPEVKRSHRHYNLDHKALMCDIKSRISIKEYIDAVTNDVNTQGKSSVSDIDLAKVEEWFMKVQYESIVLSKKFTTHFAITSIDDFADKYMSWTEERKTEFSARPLESDRAFLSTKTTLMLLIGLGFIVIK